MSRSTPGTGTRFSSMYCLFVLAVSAASGCADIAPPPAPGGPGTMTAAEDRNPPGFPEHFRILLTREYGMWKYDTCTLEVGLFFDTNEASLVCQSTKGGRARFAEQMSPIQAELLRDLVQASDLFGPNHAGVDATPGDGVFETLRFQSAA